MKLLNILKTILTTKNWAKLAPFLVAIVIGIAALFGANWEEANVEQWVLLIGGFLFTLLSLFVNPDKEKDEKGDEEE